MKLVKLQPYIADNPIICLNDAVNIEKNAIYLQISWAQLNLENLSIGVWCSYEIYDTQL